MNEVQPENFSLEEKLQLLGLELHELDMDLIDQKIKKHNHVRFAGYDFKKGEVILKKNNIVQPNHILKS